MPRKRREKFSLRGFLWKAKLVTKQEIDQHFSNPEGIQCFLCGRILETLNGHPPIVHRTSHEEYRARYGLPWRRGLVSAVVSNRLSKLLTERIRNGSFKPEPDNKAAAARIRSISLQRIIILRTLIIYKSETSYLIKFQMDLVNSDSKSVIFQPRRT